MSPDWEWTVSHGLLPDLPLFSENLRAPKRRVVEIWEGTTPCPKLTLTRISSPTIRVIKGTDIYNFCLFSFLPSFSADPTPKLVEDWGEVTNHPYLALQLKDFSLPHSWVGSILFWILCLLSPFLYSFTLLAYILNFPRKWRGDFNFCLPIWNCLCSVHTPDWQVNSV